MTDVDKLLSLAETLPEDCEIFLTASANEKALSTRLAYARELNDFFDYLIGHSKTFAEINNKKEITLDDIKQISGDDISKYTSFYLDRNHAERTVARKRAALSSFFKYLIRNKKVDFNPALASAKVEIHTSDDVTYINIEEQRTLLRSIASGLCLDDNKAKYHNTYKTRDYALVMLLLDTGMRVSELQQIDIKDVDFENCSVIVTRKGGNLQTIYFSNEASGCLLEYLDERKIRENENYNISNPLFVSLKGERLTVRSIERLVKKYSIAALPGKGSKITPHKMRSSFAMEYYDSTTDILALQRKLGHKSLAATNIYAKATDKKMQETRSILEKKRNM